MRVLLDAHTLLWAETDDDRLPEAVRRLIDDPGTRLVLSVATTWELTVKALAGRLRLPEAPGPKWYQAQLSWASCFEFSTQRNRPIGTIRWQYFSRYGRACRVKAQSESNSNHASARLASFSIMACSKGRVQGGLVM